MKNKIIIHKKVEIPDAEALWLVLSVVRQGRISGNGECYCYASISSRYAIIAGRTKSGSDVFRIQANSQAVALQAADR